MSLDALRSLQEQASPEIEEHDPRSMEQRRRDDARQTANHRFGELGKAHLLPITEALETTQCWYWSDGECADRSPGDPCDRCCALKALQEALE